MEYFKNPIILGLIACGACYAYLKWDEYQEKQKNPDKIIEPPSMKNPIIFGIIVFLGVSIWATFKNNDISLDYGRQNLDSGNSGLFSGGAVNQVTNIKIPNDIMTSSPPLIMNKTLGDALPRVFLETI